MKYSTEVKVRGTTGRHIKQYFIQERNITSFVYTIHLTSIVNCQWDFSWLLSLCPEVRSKISLILFWIILPVIKVSHFFKIHCKYYFDYLQWKCILEFVHCVKKILLWKMCLLRVYPQLWSVSLRYISQIRLNYMHYTTFILSVPASEAKVLQDTFDIPNFGQLQRLKMSLCHRFWPFINTYT